MSSRGQVTVTTPWVSCFGDAIYGLKICNCPLDVTFGILKDVISINDLWRHYNEKCELTLGVNLFWEYHKSYFIACCRSHIFWMISTDYDNLTRNCSEKCEHIMGKYKPELSCLKILDELYDFCLSCNNILCNDLASKLHTIATPRHGLKPNF